MDSLANYGSDGDNSDYSEDPKNNKGRSQAARERSNDVNYDPVQMDMSEDSNNNHSSGDNSNSEERGKSRSPVQSSQSSCSRSKGDSSRRVSSDQRSCATAAVGEERHRSGGSDNSKHDRYRQNDSGKSSRRDHHRDSRRSRDDDRKREKGRDERRDDKRDKRRDRERRHSRSERTKERGSRDEVTGSRSQKHHHKDKRSKTRSRSRSKSKSKDRSIPPPPPPRALSYREEKGRSKLAQLEKLGIELKTPDGIALTTIQGMEPSFYNPLATATQGKYAEQIQKRKLLWANKAKQDEGKSTVTAGATNNTWVDTTFVQDQDGKMTAKFKRLMGIKGEAAASTTPGPGQKPDILKKQEEMFTNMEQQYEVARATTHTQRGVGLGYASGGYQFSR